jgi:hypothetical protein
MPTARAGAATRARVWVMGHHGADAGRSQRPARNRPAEAAGSFWVSRLAQQLRQLGEVHSHPVIYTDPEGDDAP